MPVVSLILLVLELLLCMYSVVCRHLFRSRDVWGGGGELVVLGCSYLKGVNDDVMRAG